MDPKAKLGELLEWLKNLEEHKLEAAHMSRELRKQDEAKGRRQNGKGSISNA